MGVRIASMALTAEGLVAGPRGRGLCLAVARRLSEEVPDAYELQYAEEVRDADATAAALVRWMDTIDLRPLATLTAPDALVREVQASVDAAMYWQEPWLHDQLLARPELRDPLRRVAEALVASPATAWWSSPVDLAAQHHVHDLYDERPQELPDLTATHAQVLRQARGRVDDEARAGRERPRDVRASYSGLWWSTPGGPPTTRAVGGLPLGLRWTEDTAGDPSVVRAVRLTRERPRVLELDGPDDWVALVREHPLGVTASTRHDWWRVTGLDVAWAIPDWAAVAEAWDAVHLTVTGYLTTATRAHRVDADVHTVLGGWGPDATYWLADVLEVAGPTVVWDLEDDEVTQDDVWRPRP